MTPLCLPCLDTVTPLHIFILFHKMIYYMVYFCYKNTFYCINPYSFDTPQADMLDMEKRDANMSVRPSVRDALHFGLHLRN